MIFIAFTAYKYLYLQNNTTKHNYYEKKLTSGKILILAAALTLGMGSFTAYRMAQTKTEPLSDLTVANLEAMGISWEDLEASMPPMPSENHNALVPDRFNFGGYICTGPGSAC